MLWGLWISNRKGSRFKRCMILVTGVFLLAAVFCGDGFAASKVVKQEVFSSPEEASAAFYEALKAKDRGRLSSIFGPEGNYLIFSGDDTMDSEAGERAVAMFQEKKKIVREGVGRAILELGGESWPFPIPIIEGKQGWCFDTKEGKAEILRRRIGKGELGAIQVCLAYVDAQREYAAEDHGGDGVPQYAKRFFSQPGKRDGLYWEAREGERPSPVGIFMANAWNEGYRRGEGKKPSPYHGYYFRILTGQGKNARGGAFDYVVKGRMIGGFALLAYPAKYKSTGVMTFMVSHEGVVYQKDIGRNTESVVQRIKLFDPDRTWREVH